jgi:enamine deaminase RidA (YjgF/YER057c/UK114 family)
MAGVVIGRLRELGLELPGSSPPLADYVPAVRSGNLVFTSGQLPMVAGQLLATGSVGTQVSPAEAAELASRAALNAIAALAGLGVDPDRVTRVVKVVGYVASSPGFTGQPGVVNGASALLAAAFGDVGRHARSAVGVASLPLGSPVEVEVIFEIEAGS